MELVKPDMSNHTHEGDREEVNDADFGKTLPGVERENERQNEPSIDAVPLKPFETGELSGNLPRRPNKRKIHMSVDDCFVHSQTPEGAAPLCNPSLDRRDGKSKVNLYPSVSRKKQRKHVARETGDELKPVCESSFISGTLSVQPGICDIDLTVPSTSVDTAPASHIHSIVPAQISKNATLTQSSMLSFMKRTPEKRKSEVDESRNAHSQESKGRRSVMYSPIKKLASSDVIYISDNSSDSSPASQLHVIQPTSQRSASSAADIGSNPVVKQLFDAQKTLSLSPGKKWTKIKPSNKKPSPFVSKAVKESAGKFNVNNCDADGKDAVLINGSEMLEHAGPKDTYGLLGSGQYPASQQPAAVNYFQLLPPEVLEIIFSQLPMLDLCLNCNRVCLAWRDLISSDKFVPWKKLYHRQKKGVQQAVNDVQTLMKKNGMTSPSSYLAALIRYMQGFKPVTASGMSSCLKKHPKYQWAYALIQERFQHLITEKEANPWCVIAVLVIVSHSVSDVSAIMRCLLGSSSQCSLTEVLECLYCIATFLYAFKLTKRAAVWNGMHYRLFYALYLFENDSSSTCGDLQDVMAESSGQQSLYKYSGSNMKVQLTHEQLRIVKHKAGPREVIKIVAFAGTGKTTTLVRYTQLRPDKKFLLVVYNKSVRDHACKMFPPHVTCKTGHSLAFAEVGRRYSAAGKLWSIKVYGLTQILPSRKGDNLYLRAKFVLDTMDHFFASADEFITTAHVPSERLDDKTGNRVAIDHEAKMRYVQDAELLWNRMKDLSDKKVGMPHDGYLKLYQLRKPRLTSYDCILIDEAQDLTPDILLSQPQGKILVGDPNQQIYSFRGAVNAMGDIRADTIFYLTQSFRFGPEIAYVAASCLEVLKRVKTQTLVGSGKPGSITGEQVGQLAIISRCNYNVFNEAVKKCCYSDEPCKVAFVGGTDNFGFPMLLDMYALMLSPTDRKKEGRTIQHKLIRSFDNFGALDAFATKSMDTELLGKIRIVKNFHHNLPFLIKKILEKTVHDMRQADYVFTTAHKAKGLEFSSVRVTDDFMVGQQAGFIMAAGEVLFQLPTLLRNENSDEGNLLYVAVSRAKNALQMTPTVATVLAQTGEKFDYPVLSKELAGKGESFKCKETDATFEPKALTLKKQEVKLGDGTVLHGGLYSPEILTAESSSFAELLGMSSESKAQDASSQDAVEMEV